MNKLFTKIAALALGMTMATGVGVAVASSGSKANPAEAAASYAFTGNTVTFANQGLANDTQYDGDFTNAASDNTFKVNFTGGGNDGKYYTSGTGIRTYGGGSVNVTALNGGTLTEVVFTFSGSSYAAPTGNITGYTLSNATGTWTGSASTISLTRASGSGHWRLQKVKATVSSGSKKCATPSPSYDDSTKEVSWAAVEHAASYQVKVDSGSYATATSPYDVSGLTTGVQHTVSVIAKASSGYEDSDPGSRTFTPTAPFVAKTYVLCTSTDDLDAGSNYIITNGVSGTVQTMSTETNANNRKKTDVTASSSKISSTESTLVVQLGGSTGAWTFETLNYTDTNGYLSNAASGTSNHLLVGSTAREFTISFSSDQAVITATSGSERNIVRYNSGSSCFACYGSGQNPVYLWKESDGATLTLDDPKHLDYVGNSFALEATADGYTPSSWNWSASPTGIVSISFNDNEATITPTGAGTTTITVSAPNGATPKTATCAVTITSQSGADTSHLLTIDDAILIANHTGTTHTSSSYYLEGAVDSLVDDKYPMLQGTSASIEVYKDCSATVYAGDTIRVHGPIFKYNDSQPEFDNTSTVELINIPVASVTASNSTPIQTNVSEGSLADYLTVVVNGTNGRNATNQGWKVTNSSDPSVIDISGADGKTFDSGSTVGTATLTIASTGDTTKTTTVQVTTIDPSTPVLQSVTVSGTPSKSTQYVGQPFDWTGLTFTPVYDPVKQPVEEIDGDDIEWDALVDGEDITGTYTGDNDVSVTVTVTSVSVEPDGIYSVVISGDMSKKTYDEDASWNYGGLVVKVTYKSAPSTQVDPSSEVTWRASATPKQLGVGTGKSVNVYATVGEVESSAYTVSNLTITEHQADKYGLYSGTLVEGDYVIVYDGKAMNTTVSGDRLQYSEPTISNNVIEDPNSSIVWHIAASGNYWTLYNAAADAYAAGTGAKNKAQMLVDGTDDKSMWTVSGTSTYEFVNKANAASSVNANLRENGTYGFACYATGTGGALSLYKLNYLPKAFDHFDYVDGTPDRTNYMVGETFDPAGLQIDAVYTEPSIYPQENITSQIVWDALVAGSTATGTWSGKTVTITGLTITAFTPATYTKLTSIDQLTVGSEVIIGGYKSSTTTYYVLDGFDSNHFTAGTTTTTSTTMETTSSTLIFTVEADRNGYYFKNGNNYIKRSESDSGFGEKDSNACWNITFGEEGAVTMTNGSSGNTQFQFNDGSPRFKNYGGTQKSIYIYVKEAASETNVLKTYASRYLLLENETLDQIPSGPTGVSGTDCLGSTGPYMTAKAALTSGDFSAHVSNFQSSSDPIVANARLRYESWARAYGDTTPYANSVGNSRVIINGIISNSNGGTVAIVVVTSVISFAAIGGYFFLRKRREQN